MTAKDGSSVEILASLSFLRDSKVLALHVWKAFHQ